MKYSGVITVKAEGKEQNVYLEFEKDNVYDILRAYEAILNPKPFFVPLAHLCFLALSIPRSPGYTSLLGSSFI